MGLVALGLVIWLVGTSVGAASPRDSPPASIGVALHRPLPASIATLALVDQFGRTTSLRAFTGRTVLLAPFLTSCQEECPITTGALLDVQDALVRAHLANRVSIIEVTVDPGRDTPDRMRAFARLTGTTWPLLTATPSALAQLWRYFGVWYQKVPEGSPPGINWQTNQPYTYDVNHTDGFVLLDSTQHERFDAGGMTKLAGLPTRLRSLLDAQGEDDLVSPGGGSWSVSDALRAIAWVLGEPIATPR